MKQIAVYLFTALFMMLAYDNVSGAEDKGIPVYKNADEMIRTGKFLGAEGYAELNLSIKTFPAEGKQLLYDKYKKNNFAVLEAAANIFPSLGSWLQGDITGALITDIGMGSTLGAALILVAIFPPSNTYGTADGDGPSINYIAGVVGLTLFGISLAFYAANIAYPFIHAYVWNQRLKEALELPDSGLTMSPHHLELTDHRDQNAFALNLFVYRF